MKLTCLRLAFAWLASFVAASAASDTRVYELRTYTATPGNLEKVVARFREHTTRLFEKHGMTNLGYWVPADEKSGSGDKLVYLLAHSSREATSASWKAFSADPAWQAVKKKTEADGRIVSNAESVFLQPTDFSPPMEAKALKGGKHVYELRTYTAAEGKLAALDARFRNHTIKLFAKHGMTNLGYFHPTDANKGAGTTLVYFLAHKDRDAAAASWKAFREDADWAKARKESEKDGRLTTKVESVFLTPTDFSALK